MCYCAWYACETGIFFCRQTSVSTNSTKMRMKCSPVIHNTQRMLEALTRSSNCVKYAIVHLTHGHAPLSTGYVIWRKFLFSAASSPTIISLSLFPLPPFSSKRRTGRPTMLLWECVSFWPWWHRKMLSWPVDEAYWTNLAARTSRSRHTASDDTQACIMREWPGENGCRKVVSSEATLDEPCAIIND